MTILSGVYNKLSEKYTAEHVILLIFVTTATLMLIGTREFSYISSIFPRVMASIVIILGLMLLFKNYLPEPLHSIATDDVDLFQTEVEEESDNPSEMQDHSSTDEVVQNNMSGSKLRFKNSTVIFILTSIYFILAYLISILYATPIFVILYSYKQSISWYNTAILATISIGIVWLFMELLNIPMSDGYLLDLWGSTP